MRNFVVVKVKSDNMKTVLLNLDRVLYAEPFVEPFVDATDQYTWVTLSDNEALTLAIPFEEFCTLAKGEV